MCVFDDKLAQYGYSPRRYLIEKIDKDKKIYTPTVNKVQKKRSHRYWIDLKSSDQKSFMDLRSLSKCLDTIIEKSETCIQDEQMYPEDYLMHSLTNDQTSLMMDLN